MAKKTIMRNTKKARKKIAKRKKDYAEKGYSITKLPRKKKTETKAGTHPWDKAMLERERRALNMKKT